MGQRCEQLSSIPTRTLVLFPPCSGEQPALEPLASHEHDGMDNNAESSSFYEVPVPGTCRDGSVGGLRDWGSSVRPGPPSRASSAASARSPGALPCFSLAFLLPEPRWLASSVVERLFISGRNRPCKKLRCVQLPAGTTSAAHRTKNMPFISCSRFSQEHHHVCIHLAPVAHILSLEYMQAPALRGDRLRSWKDRFEKQRICTFLLSELSCDNSMDEVSMGKELATQRRSGKKGSFVCSCPPLSAVFSSRFVPHETCGEQSNGGGRSHGPELHEAVIGCLHPEVSRLQMVKPALFRLFRLSRHTRTERLRHLSTVRSLWTGAVVREPLHVSLVPLVFIENAENGNK